MTVVPEEAVTMGDRMSGWVLKASDVIHNVACRRFGVLENDVFCSSREENDAKTATVYPLHHRCEISGLEQKDILVRAKGKNTFVALVAGKCERIDGMGQGRSPKYEKLILGFASETAAARWQTGFLRVIDRLAKVQETEISSPPLPMDISSTQTTNRLSQLEIHPTVGEEPPNAFASPIELAPERAQQRSQSVYHDWVLVQADEELCRSMSGESAILTSATTPEGGQSASRPRPYGFWSPWKLANGLAIYKEDDPSDGVDAFMVSCIVRSTPGACFSALMARTNDRTTGSMGFLNMEVIDKVDEQLDLVRGRIQLNGWFKSVLAPREIVLDRSWRKEEEDGTYVVMMKSSDRYISEDSRHRRLPETIGESLWNPVQSQVLATVFTVAPLQDKYFKTMTESPEALMTMVLKIDLGGVLSPGHIMSPLLQFMGSRDAWIESVLMNIVTLRDRVEQTRFVSPPFSLESGVIPQSPLVQRDRPAASLCHWTSSEKQELSRMATNPPTGETDNQITGVVCSSPCDVPPLEERLTGTLDTRYWTCPGAAGYRVRGPNYLTDKKKIPASEPMFQLVSVDLIKLQRPTRHIAQHLRSIKSSQSPFSFIVQIMVPGPPHLSLVITWGSREDSHSLENTSANVEDQEASNEPEHDLPPFDVALMSFFTGDDETRNSSFKLIPHIIKGSFIIRQSVGSTPVLLGRKLKQDYYKTAKYIEVDINVGSSYTAATVVNMVSGVTKTLVVDLAVVLEGKSREELPEALLGTVRLNHLDLNTAIALDIPENSSDDGQPREINSHS